MDKETIRQAVHNAIDGIQTVVQERVQGRKPFDVVAVVLATVDDTESRFDSPMLLYITPEAGITEEQKELLTPEEFIDLLRFTAKTFAACGVIRGYYDCSIGGPAVSVELPNNEWQLALPTDANQKVWFWQKKDYQLDEPTLPVNMAH